MDEDYLTVSQYADHHNRTDGTVRKWARDGRLPGASKIDGQWRIPRDVLPRYSIGIHKKNRRVIDDLYDILQAFNNRMSIDAEILGCSPDEYNRMLHSLKEGGLIENRAAPEDTVNEARYSITFRGAELADNKKADCIRQLIRISDLVGNLASTILT